MLAALSGARTRGTPPQQSPQAARLNAGGSGVSPGRAAHGQQDQVLFAVMSLLPLLGPEHLRVVTSEVRVLHGGDGICPDTRC